MGMYGLGEIDERELHVATAHSEQSRSESVGAISVC